MNDAMGHQDQPGDSGEQPIKGGTRGPVRRPRDGAQAPDAADRLTTLTHELRNLLDGSLRWIAIAERDLPRTTEGTLADELERTRRQLDTVKRALEHMNELVRTSSMGGLSLGTPAFGPTERISLGEALDHAADVVRPRASSLGIELSVTIDQRAGPRAAGPMYSVMLNALHNAVDAIERRLAGRPGVGLVSARLGWTERGGVSRAVLEVLDDGEGPPELDDPDRVFSPEYSKKAPGQGIGLALSRQIVLELGGRIELAPRKDGPGAVLRAVFPAPSVVGESA
jgi:signal transduction histidine kinase